MYILSMIALRTPGYTSILYYCCQILRNIVGVIKLFGFAIINCILVAVMIGIIVECEHHPVSAVESLYVVASTRMVV